MKIHGTIPMRFCPNIPANLSGQIIINTTTDIYQHEGELLYVAMYCVSQLVAHGMSAHGFANIYFVDSDELRLVQDDLRIGGYYLPLVVFPVHRWRALKLDDWRILTVMLEELCHSLFVIRDELAVKHRVTEAARIYNPNVTIQQLYPGL